METQAQAQLTVMPTPETNAAPTGFRWKWLLYLGVVMVLLAAARYFNVQDLLKQALDGVVRLGPWGPVIFIAIYVVATVLLIPGSVLTFGAGAVFGLIRGTWIGMLPGTVMYVYLGSLANVSAAQRARTLGEWALYGVGLLATIGVTVFVTRIARKALSKKIAA